MYVRQLEVGPGRSKRASDDSTTRCNRLSRSMCYSAAVLADIRVPQHCYPKSAYSKLSAHR